LSTRKLSEWHKYDDAASDTQQRQPALAESSILQNLDSLAQMEIESPLFFKGCSIRGKMQPAILKVTKRGAEHEKTKRSPIVRAGSSGKVSGLGALSDGLCLAGL
jgi:hypothetical protein